MVSEDVQDVRFAFASRPLAHFTSPVKGLDHLWSKQGIGVKHARDTDLIQPDCIE